jgi:death-on-curing protein
MDRHWNWIEQAVILAIHEEQLAEHGGAIGIRDSGLLASALARPGNLANYADPDAADLAASYAFGIARNHPFDDGNKRTAFVAAELFLALNGQALDAKDSDCVAHMLALAAGDLDEVSFAAWLHPHLRKR